jgi:hypothetical protein
VSGKIWRAKAPHDPLLVILTRRVPSEESLAPTRLHSSHHFLSGDFGERVDIFLEKADGVWQMADGRWQMADGRWQMADGRWQMADGRWQMGSGWADDGWPILVLVKRF